METAGLGSRTLAAGLGSQTLAAGTAMGELVAFAPETVSLNIVPYIGSWASDHLLGLQARQSQCTGFR